jgi:shikimate kinase
MLTLLIGLRGSGKSTLGAAASRRLGVPFLDLDDLTREVLGAASVSEAWNNVGERKFREAEMVALRRALATDARIIALGGGTPTAPGAAAIIEKERQAGHLRVIYLRATAATLRERLRGKMHDRPSLTGDDPLAEIEKVLEARDPVYVALADEVLNLDGVDEEKAVACVVGAMPK